MIVNYAILIFLFVLAVALIVWQVSNMWSVFLGAPPISSPKHPFFELLGDKNKTLLDLGCASGTTVIQASRYFKHVYGIEYSPWYFWLAKWRTRKLKNVTILHANFMTSDWPDVDIIYCYLLPPLLRRVSEKLKKNRATVWSYGFEISGWKGQKLTNSAQKLFIYPKNRQPAKS